MSLIHNIITERVFDLQELAEISLSMNGVMLQHRGENTFYFWVDEKSTRGVDVTFEQGYIEIRNTILSNKHDYELTNNVVKELLAKSKGILLNADREEISSFPIFHEDLINEIELHDGNVVNSLLEAGEDITIFGPIRKVHFGKNLHANFRGLHGKELTEQMFERILAVNYQIPDYEYGNLLQIGNSDKDKKIAKLLTNKSNCIIDKYDLILFNTDNDHLIIITNEILNTILPSSWLLVDEFTIVAPIISQKEWTDLLNKAKKFDMWNEFTNNQ
ncbi:MAG: hypothetical protein ACK5LR_08550 [Mangrovibacterium sp.]